LASILANSGAPHADATFVVPLSPPLVSGESARTGLSVHIWTHALYQQLRYGFLGTLFFPLQTIFIWDHTEYAMPLMFPLCVSSGVAAVHLGGGITVCAILMTSYRPVPRSRTTNTRTSMGSSHKPFAPAIVGMSGQIHADFLRLLWVLADKQFESIGKENKIGNEAFRWARAKVFNYNKTSVGRAIAFGCATRCHLSVHSLAMGAL